MNALPSLNRDGSSNEPQTATSRPLTALVSVAACLGAVAAGTVWRWHGLAVGRVWLVLALAAVAVAAQMSPLLLVRNGEGAEVDVDEAVIAAALLLLPPGGVLCAALLSTACTHVLRRRDSVKGLYNVSVRALSVSVGLVVATAIAGTGLGDESARAFVAAGIGALAAGIISSAMVWLVISVVAGTPLRHLAIPWVHVDLYIMILAVLWGVLAVAASTNAVYALILLAVPVAVAQQLYHSQRQRELLETLLRSATATAAAVRTGTVEQAVGAAIRDGLRTRVGEVRDRPPQAGEIGRPLLPRESGRWLIAAGKHQRDRFVSQDDALLDGLTAIASIAMENQSLLDIVGRDPVTQLPFGALLMERVAAALTDDRHPGTTAILVVKVLRLDLIKQTFGPESTSAVLAEIGGRLRQLAPDHPEDVLRTTNAGYLGDGEFAIVVQDVEDREDALSVARTVTEVVCDPVLLDGNDLTISVSVGVALSGTDQDHSEATPVTLLRDALTTAARIARVGGEPVQIAETGIGASAAARLRLERDLQVAMRRGEITVHYQPVIDVATGHVAGAEALVRWDHPTAGVLPPSDFVPLAEETGLIVELDRLVLATACRQLARWQTAGRCPVPFRLAVNLSARQLAETDLVDVVADVLRRTGADADWLVLELTESSVMHDAASASLTLRSLHDLGVQLAIDDFGTGYSSLAYLRDLAVDALKIDRSFLAGLTTRAGDAEIVAATVGLAHTLGLRVVAEGVETVEQLDALRTLGCEFAQGFLWSKPVPTETFAADWLAAGAGSDRAATGA